MNIHPARLYAALTVGTIRFVSATRWLQPTGFQLSVPTPAT